MDMTDINDTNIDTNTTSNNIELKLGDEIKITDLKDERINNQVFFIDYIDQTKLILINTLSLSKEKININPDGTMNDGTISKLEILSRSDVDGFARQNSLLPNTWVNIHFDDEGIPLIITGEITNLENDMIEIKTIDNDVIYINFDYKGLPETLPISLIEIRGKPDLSRLQYPVIETDIETDIEIDIVEPNTALLDIQKPTKNIKDQIREFVLTADLISYGDEEYGEIKQLVDVSDKAQRYSIETQTTDLLDELLSTKSDTERTNSVLDGIHLMIQRFTQLRELFSEFDEYGNVKGVITKGIFNKQLMKYFDDFKTNLYWILPVVKNVTKIYTQPAPNELTNIDIISQQEDLLSIRQLIENYNNLPNQQNRYSSLYKDLNPHFTPFLNQDESNTITDKMVRCDLNVIIDNLDELYSSIFTNDKVKRRRFVIRKYNLGLDKLDSVSVPGGKKITTRVMLTPNDTMSIKSILTLPEPTIRFSKINLPGTNLIDKANLNLIFLNYWRFLKQKTKVNTIFIDNLNSEIVFDEENFVNNIKNFILQVPENQLAGMTKNEIYTKFAQTLIPQIKVLFNLVKKYIVGKLSVVDVVGYLEPFLIYTDDLTYKQYEEITNFIDNQISSFNVRFKERARIFSRLVRNKTDNIIYSSAYSLVSLINDKQNIRETVFNLYNINIDKIETFTNSEIMRRLNIVDSQKLYSSALSLQSVALMVPDTFNDIFVKNSNNTDKQVMNDGNSADCKPIVIAKSYNNVADVEKDNGKNIYFDRRFDNTNYGLIGNYEKEIMQMKPDELILYMQDNLTKTLKINAKDALYLAETILNGYKQVIDGQYALLVSVSDQYYIRQKNIWIETAKPVQNVVTSSENILCNLRKKCISNPDKYEDKCDSTDLSASLNKKQFLNDIMSEFDDKYKLSIQEIQHYLQGKYEYYLSIMDKINTIETNKFFKYNKEQYELGFLIEEEEPTVVSPFYKLRNMILSQTDIIKKQQDIVRFVTFYTRPANINTVGPLGEFESSAWLYCKTTNVQLLPQFKYHLATIFLNDRDNYDTQLELMKQHIGKISDDGDSWVDKDSGWVIAKIDMDVDEGYEEGRKTSTRDLIVEDIGDRIITGQLKPIKFDSPNSKMISNIVNTISHNIGINLDHQKEFIINCVLQSLNSIDDEPTYINKLKNKTKDDTVVMSYIDLYNSTILFYTVGMILIAIQTSIPSIKTRKTFPNCVKSFDGYPFEGSGNLDSVEYLSCIVYKIKTGAEPWNVLKRMKQTIISSKIKRVIDGILISIPDVERKIQEKTVYLLSNPQKDIPDAINATNWTEFLPPLVNLKASDFSQLQNITNDFQKQLINDFKQGNKKQRENILIIQSKIIIFSIALQQKIQQVVSTKNALLRKANTEPFLENACCSSTSKETTIQYFETEDKTIKQYNEIVANLSNILNDIDKISKAGLFYSDINTKNIYPAVTNKFHETTIYLAFINFCKFNSQLPIPDYLKPFCGYDKKPIDMINPNDTLNEIIIKLKNDGKNYTEAQFLKLLQIVARNNIIETTIDTSAVSCISKLRNILQNITPSNKEEETLTLLQTELLDTFQIGNAEINKQAINLNNFLITKTRLMREQLISFISQHSSSVAKSTNTSKKITLLLDNLMKWSLNNPSDETSASNDPIFTVINFFNTFIDNFVNVFPNIIINKVNHDNVSIPTYMKLSKHHSKLIKTYISQYYEKLKHFYGVNTLNNILISIQNKSKNIVLLANSTPCFSYIKRNNETIIPIYDEKTNKYLFEYYLLKVFSNYVELSEQTDMIVTGVVKPIEFDDIFTVESIDDDNTRTNVDITKVNEEDNIIVSGNKKDLKQTTANLLLTFINIMNEHKTDVDMSYEYIIDKVYRSKDKEKNMIIDRLENLEEEDREIDTILKINKLGVWNKGLQKGLTTYDKDNFDDELEFMQQMDSYEKKIRNTNPNIDDRNMDIFVDDLREQDDTADEIEREVYDMSGFTDNYGDGNYGEDEVDDYNEFDS